VRRAATLVEFVKGAAADLDEFLDLVHEQIVCSPVVHFDETVRVSLGVDAGFTARAPSR